MKEQLPRQIKHQIIITEYTDGQIGVNVDEVPAMNIFGLLYYAQVSMDMQLKQHILDRVNDKASND